MITSKIKILSVLIGLFLVLAMVPLALAANEDGKIIRGGNLIITKVDAKADGKTDKNLDFDDLIRREAKPGSAVEFKIEFTNNFTKEDDLKIENIDTTVTIEGIDDGDDMDQDAKEFDLRPGRDDTITVQFNIPLEVDEDTFDVLINAEGEDENGTTHEVEFELQLEIKKEDNEVLFLQNALSPSEVKCGRKVQLSAGVINTGADDEDGVVMEIVNAELGISFKETFDLSNSPFDDDSKFRKTFTFNVPGDAKAGTYAIPTTILYDNGKKTATETADIVVNDCEVLKEEDKTAEEEKKEDESVVVVQPQVIQPTDQNNVITAGTVSAPALPATEEKSLFESSGFLAALVAGEVLLAIIAILLVVSVVKKRRD